MAQPKMKIVPLNHAEIVPVRQPEIVPIVRDLNLIKDGEYHEILSAPLTVFKIPTVIHETLQKKKLDPIIYTMGKCGQIEPITVVKRPDGLYITHGVNRFVAAGILGIPMLKYVVIDIPDSEIIKYRMIQNQSIKRSYLELCSSAEHILNLVGKSQGKKRDLLGFQNMASDEEFGEVGKDRFDLACAVLGIKMKSSTLRKLMEVFWYETARPKEERLGLLEFLDKGKLSIDGAKKMIKSPKLPENKPPVLPLHPINGGDKIVWYQLHNKSAMDMSEVPDESVRLAIDSHPYLWQRKYRNQDELCHGWEDTVEEYVANFVKFCREKWKKLVAGGVLVTILGETYKGGYKGVGTKVETALDKDGWIILDMNPWEKTNGKYAPHPNRFINSYERIIVAQKPGAKPYFKEVERESSTKKFKVKPTSSGGVYLATPDTCITNVIRTSVHNSKELKVIDEDFQHDAPCVESVYKIFIEAYSQVGDVLLESFIGSGTAAIGIEMGRSIIGYDVDPESIEFSKKRCEEFLKKYDQNQLLQAA